MARRRYDISTRRAAAAARRLAVAVAAKELFEQHGWAGTRVADVAARAGVSQKLVEASFGTKAALLEAAVEYAIRGDVEPVPMLQRERIREMEAAPDAAAMLLLHATHLREVNTRSARIALVVEQAAPADPAAAAIWRQMNRNRDFAVRWATDTLWKKRGRRRGLTRARVAAAFWVALDWGTYTTLTERAGLDDDGFERWLREYYAAMLLSG
jgi:TetR/AcrR family transcriptional regulator, regulator of autoinduction and epiphytic fitness